MREARKIIVTGGAGFIGSHAVVELVNDGFEPIIVDDFSNAEPVVLENLQKLTGKEIRCYKVNCAKYDEFKQVFEKEKNIYGVIHFAALKAVSQSFVQALEYYDNNINSTIVLIRLMKEYKANYIVFSSSCTVYGEPDKLPVTEEFPFRPALSPYGNTKRICEEMLRDSLRSAPGLKVISLRYFNPIGAHPSALIGELPIGTPNNLLPYVMQVATGQRDHVTVYGDDYDTPDGTCIRDYIHVVDLAKAHIRALEYIPNCPHNYDAFNVGIGKGMSVLAIIKMVEKASGKKVNYKMGERREGDIAEMFANPSKANRVLNWRAALTIDEAIEHAWKFQQRIAGNNNMQAVVGARS